MDRDELWGMLNDVGGGTKHHPGTDMYIMRELFPNQAQVVPNDLGAASQSDG